MNPKDLLKAFLIYKLGQSSRPDPPEGPAPSGQDTGPGLGCGCLTIMGIIGIAMAIAIIWAIRQT